MDILDTILKFCLFVRWRISPPRIKLVLSNFAGWSVGVLGWESHILGNFAHPEAHNRTNRPAREGRWMFQLVTPRRAYLVRTACGRRIGMCGYTSVPEDRHTWHFTIIPTFDLSLWCSLNLFSVDVEAKVKPIAVDMAETKANPPNGILNKFRYFCGQMRVTNIQTDRPHYVRHL